MVLGFLQLLLKVVVLLVDSLVDVHSNVSPAMFVLGSSLSLLELLDRHNGTAHILLE